MDLILLLVLLVLSAFFSGSETAFFSLRQSELAQLASRGDAAGRRVVSLVNQAHSLLSALLIGNLIVNTAASVVAAGLCLRVFGENGLLVAVPLATGALLIGGEITPKMLALRFRKQLSLFAQQPISLWLGFTRPLLRVIVAATDWLLSILTWERTGTRRLTTAELETACDLATQDGTLSLTEGRFLARLLLLHDLEVHQIMTPRPDVVTLQGAWTRQEILTKARQAGFNRYPVMVEENTQPVGLFHLKDLLAEQNRDRPLTAELRPLLFVPESKDVAALLSEMRSGQTHLAAVVDEHGDFTGIVTMADCLQTLTGHAADVKRKPDHEIYRIGARSWIIGGRVDLRELRETCDVSLPASRDYVTVAGYVMSQLGRIPQQGERLTAETARFTILEMAGLKIVRMQMDRWQGSGPREQA